MLKCGTIEQRVVRLKRVGCSGHRGEGGGDVPIPPTPKAMFDTDYGAPTGLCKETSAGSAIFERDWTKATVQVDCNKWQGKVTMKATARSVFEDQLGKDEQE